MCIPKGKKRTKQKSTAATIPQRDSETLQMSCSEAKPRPTLMSLTVADATACGEGRYWAVKDAVKTVQLRAVTEPDDETGWSLLEWTGASSVSADKRDATVALDSVKDSTVSAKLDEIEKSATIEIYDLVSLTCPLPNGKGYHSNESTRLKAVTNPDESKVWKLLTWSEGAPTPDGNECDAALKPVGARKASVKLADKALETDLRVCQWPKLQIKEITFESHPVFNDGATEIDVAFDNKWVRGRNDIAINQKTADSQAPVCFTRGKKIKLQALFEVVDPATEDEDVKVEAALGFAKIEGTVKVSAAAVEAPLAWTQSSAALPNTVDANDAWTINWRHQAHDGTWVDADTSTHVRYVLLNDPAEKLYLTLLDISCVAAKGTSTANALVTESFKPFAAAKGTGNGFMRKGDGVRMSYYNQGTSTGTGDAVQTTAGMLGSADGTGRCGGWATLLGHLWQMHGVTSSQRWFIRATEQSLMNFDLRFLVKNCTFKATGTRANSAYTHEGEIAKKEVEKTQGIPGHGQDNPQFDFGDHVVVMYGGKIYDPSYGVGPYDTDVLYFDAALDGLGKWPKIDFNFKGIDQHVPEECVPYAEGFAEYTIVLNPLDRWAKDFGTTGAALFPHCDFYFPTASTPITVASLADVKPGHIVRVVTSSGAEWERMGPTMSLQEIALKHGKTDDEVFLDPKNARIKTLRTDKANLESGDTIVVSKALDPDCWLVVGHDL